MRPALTLLLPPLPAIALAFGAACASPLGAPVTQGGVEITPGLEASVQFDRSPTSPAPDSVFLVAEVHATKDGEATYKKTGLLYPTAGKNGPRYVGITEMNGPGSYHLSYLVSPPSAHGMYRQTGKDNGVPDWWTPITAKWAFTYPTSTASSK